MWKPELTAETVEDIPDEPPGRARLGALLAGFGMTAEIVTAAGAGVAYTTGNIADATGLSETVTGGLFSGVATSLPELVTTVAAVRRGALTLAVSDIVGGNFFDTLFVFAADLLYLRGSLYHAEGVGSHEVFLTTLTLLLNITLLLGLLYRQRGGPANMGFESVLMLLLYIGGFLTLSFFMSENARRVNRDGYLCWSN
jgi:cation:H+ antiporter